MNSKLLCLVITLALLSLACHRRESEVIEMLVLIPNRDVRRGGTMEYISIERTVHGASVTYQKLDDATTAFYRGSATWTAQQFETALSRIRTAGLIDSKHISLLLRPGGRLPKEWLELHENGHVARIETDNLSFYWSGKLTVDQETSRLLQEWEQLFRAARPSARQLSGDEVLQIANDCGKEWPREIQFHVWERAQWVSNFRGNSFCQDRWAPK